MIDKLIKDKINSSEKKVVCFINPENSSAIEVVEQSKKMDLCDFVLLGNKGRIKELISESNSKLASECKIIDVNDYVEGVKLAVEEIHSGKAHAIMKGDVETGPLLKELFNKEYEFMTEYRVSYLAAFEMKNYHKMLFITDPAINIKPDLSLKKNLIDGSVDFMIKLGIKKPKVGILCAKENVSPKMQATVDAKDLTEYYEKNEMCDVYGPLAFDNAISKKAATEKKIDSSVAGDVDLLLCDSIEQANTLYKALTYMANAKNAGVVLGMKVPIIVTSRTDNLETKIASIALSL